MTYSLLLFFAFSCNYNENDFSDTERHFETDKEIYRVNDNFELTVVVTPKSGEKNIRILKNLNNIKITFSTRQGELGFSQELKKHFIEEPSITGDDSKYIDKYTISKSQPLKKTFKGTITETAEKIIFKIPELKLTDSITKSGLHKKDTIIITGNCSSVYSGIEENITPKEIEIITE